MTSMDAKAVAVFVALIASGATIMVAAQIDNRPWPTAEQAISWEQLPCVETETYRQSYTYNPFGVTGGKHAYYDETRYRKAERCKAWAQIGPVFPKSCVEFSVWSGFYPMGRQACKAKLKT